MLHRHPQELSQFGNRIFVVVTPTGNGKHNEIVAQALFISISVQGVGHGDS
jgi:hypothetical protein